MIVDMGDPKLTFLIGTRNRRDSLSRCLRSIESQEYAAVEIVVVDDGSEDGTAQMLAEKFPRVTCVRRPGQEGIGAALAEGSRVASGDVLVNLDDDCELTSPGTARLITATLAEHPEIDVLCFRVEAPDGSVRHREIPLRSKRMPQVDTEIAYFLGGAVAFRASALATAGGYPVDFRYGSWENDVSFRLARAGSRILFVPGIRVVHHAIPSPDNTGSREANYARNELRLAATYLPFPYAQVHGALWVAQSLAQAVKNGRARRAMTGIHEGLAEWGSRRRDHSRRLSAAQTRRLSRLSGRTWY